MGIMSATRAVIRLWIVGSIAWIAFWAWNDATKCLRASNDRLWCPTGSPGSLGPTNYYRMAYVILSAPLWTFILGLLCWLAVRWVQRRLRSELAVESTHPGSEQKKLDIDSG